MIIKNEHSNSTYLKYIFLFLALTLLGFVGYHFLGNAKKTATTEGSIFCSMEKVSKEFFKNDSHQFGNAHTQSSEKARSGKYSSLINEKQNYGARYNLDAINEGDRVCASIWRWSPISDYGYLAIQGNSGSDFSAQNNIAEETSTEGWDKITLCVDIPEDNLITDLKIFPYSLSKHGYAFFDDLEIQVIKAESIQNASMALDVETLKLYIDKKGLRELSTVRDEALRYGILINNDKYSSGKLTSGEETQKIKLRLKGDWTDHLEGKRWSYRIKTAKDQAWNRMQTFSLQSPERRFFLKEWLFHDFLDHEGLLTTRYDFVWLKLNSEKKLLYAYEEHFDKQLPEYKHRREGVILKFSEDAAWEQRLRSKKATGHHNTLLVDAKHNSDILPFKASRIEADSNLMKQFISGQELLYAYKHYTRPVDEIFDVEKMAKYYAILEVLNAYHSLVWHNQRFYYDPVSNLLEPIGYDGFIEEAEYKINAHACFGYYKSNLHVNDWGKYYNALFRNEKFAAAYAYYIDKYSTDSYIKGYLESIDEEIINRVALLKKDFPNYNFDQKTILAKAKEINTSIPAYDNVSLKAYTEKTANGSNKINISNYHHLPLQVIGTGNEASNNPKTFTTSQKILWSNHPNMTPEYQSMSIPSDHRIVYFKILGLDRVYHSHIKKWPSGNARIATNEHRSTAIPLAESHYSTSNNIVSLKNGNYTLNKPLILSKEKLQVEAGTTIDLIDGAYILCHNAINFRGTKDHPIKITSTDKTGQGLLVLKSKNKSALKHTVFDGLDNIDKGNYFMTGAVSFYESSVDISHCQFSNNLCEDALNIIRSDFSIDHMHLNNTYADGFDADFCVGSIRDSYSSDTGNDAFDFSGSIISVDNCHFKNIGDKGISAGEETRITVNSAHIDGAEIGIASKDLSMVTIENIIVENCQQAFAAFQKKPEYGPGKISIKKYTAENNKYLQLTENDSSIEFPELQ